MSVEASITCQEVVELLSAYLDGELDPLTLERVETHLAGCDGCTMVLEEFRETIRLSGAVTVEQVDETQRRTLLEAFRDWTAGG
jgi:anti-sigma factor RsiW